LKNQHGIIQNTAKDKKASTIITGFEKGKEVLQGKALYDELLKEVSKKFNPRNLKEKIIKSEGVNVNFQEFARVLRRLPDKKAHAVDGMSASALRRLGNIAAYRYFCQWTS